MKRAAILAAWLLLAAACVAVMLGARYSTDMSAFLPSRPSARQQLLVDQIRDGALSRLVLIGLQGGTPAARAQASRDLAARLRADDAFAAVINGDAASRERDEAWLLAQRYALSPQVTPERFTPEGLRAALQGSIAALGGSAGLVLKALLPRDPTGEMSALISQMAGGPLPNSSEGVWASGDGSLALLAALTAAPGADTDAQERALARLQAAFEAAAPPASGVRLLMTGAPVFSVDARRTIRSEVGRLSLAGTLTVFFMMLAFYRSLRNVLIGLLPVASGIAAAIAAVALGFETVHAITIGFGTTLMGETIDYSIYFLVQSGAGGHPEAARQRARWLRSYWPTIRLGVLTSVCGFAALAFSSFPGLAQLGVYSVAGLLTAAAVTRYVLPALPAAPVPPGSIAWLGVRMAALRRAMQALRWPAAACAAAALLIVISHGAALWARGLSGLNPAPLALQKLDERLRGEAGAPDLRFLVIAPAATADGALAAAERAERLLAPWVQRGDILHIDSPARFLPSAAAQAARRAALPAPDDLRQRLQAATSGLPIRPERLEPFVQDVAQARQQPPLTASALQGASFDFALQTLLLPREGGWAALLPLRLPGTPTPEDIARLQAAVDQALAGAPEEAAAKTAADSMADSAADSAADAPFFLDLDAQTAALFGQYLDEALLFTSLGAAAILAVLAAALRSARALLRVLPPLAAAVLLVMAAHALAGTPLTLLHLIGLLLIVAVGSNYALFFNQNISGAQSEGGSAAALASLALANVSTLIGFGVLGLSQVPVLHAIGATVGPGALLALLLSMSWSARQPPRRDAKERAGQARAAVI
nr:MMPL family transporter [uncultured Ottowia sp.]